MKQHSAPTAGIGFSPSNDKVFFFFLFNGLFYIYICSEAVSSCSEHFTLSLVMIILHSDFFLQLTDHC
jgi:hypothetical protein